MNHNFLVNGDFINDLVPWETNDLGSVNHNIDKWNGNDVHLMVAKNLGEGWQEIVLPDKPRPKAGKAVYWLHFWYEATGLLPGAYGTVRITGAESGQTNLELVNSLRVPTEEEPQDVYLNNWKEELRLVGSERKIEVRVISPSNGGIGPGAVRFTRAEVLLLLEDLVLSGLTVDRVAQVMGEIRLCIGGTQVLEFSVESGSAWHETEAGLVRIVDTDDLLRAVPAMEQEQSIDGAWQLSCKDTREDTQVIATLAIRSKYTAELYELTVICDHFWLDIIAVEEPWFFPVIDLAQSVRLIVQVLNHFTRMPLANRKVTFKLGGTVLLEQDSDADGKVTFSWLPNTSGNHEIKASVESYYRPDEALYTFRIRAIQSDPWETFALRLDELPEGKWGSSTTYVNRGASHVMTARFSDGVLNETLLTMEFPGDETPEYVGIAITPDTQPVDGGNVSWNVVCENRRNGEVSLLLKCSKLLLASPLLKLNLGHHWLSIVDPKVLTKFPVAGGPDVRLSARIESRVPGVGGVQNVTTYWSDNGEPETTEPTGPGGNIQTSFEPGLEGDSEVILRVANSYDGVDGRHAYKFQVFGESPWAQLAKVTLDGREQGRVGLICFRDVEAVPLIIEPVGELLIEEDFSINLSSEGADLEFQVFPDPATPRKMPAGGLIYMVSSVSQFSAFFSLQVRHHSEDPDSGLPPYDLEGRLISTVLSEEGELKLDDRALAPGESIPACLGALHTLQFVPLTQSPMVGLAMSATLQDGDDLGMKLTAKDHEPVTIPGKKWELDARASTEKGVQGIVFTLDEAGFGYPPVVLPLAHNRILAQAEGPDVDLEVGQSTWLYLIAYSFYSNEPVSTLPVTFENEDDVKTVPTNESGEARYLYTAKASGTFQVTATSDSPYDADPQVKTFNVLVIGSPNQDANPTGESSVPTLRKRD
ncbi:MULTISPECIES: hypothetical protein [unclassified Pseudomonas]|uniref:hypothetical protein n=1 Tax=unclassified Pseudomonas TaxID=196821 RepID=UPI00200FDE8D|nr:MULTISPECIES: hypothetical protein [unclassified Pseudomonas]